MPCHSSPSNFAFDNYTSVKASALSGDLTHAVINDSNFVIMPPPGYGYTALDSCQIKALNLWLAQGCQNN